MARKADVRRIPAIIVLRMSETTQLRKLTAHVKAAG